MDAQMERNIRARLDLTSARFIDWHSQYQVDVRDLLAEIDRLRTALHQDVHVIAFDEYGWSIEHLVECRPFMSQCGYHLAVMRMADENGWSEQPYKTGRYVLILEPDKEVTIGKRLPDHT